MSLKIKVCGMRNYDQVRALSELGIDFAGFIFYDKSPRYVLNAFSDNEIQQISNMNISRVGVFVNEPLENLKMKVSEWKLDYVQLHGNESPAYCKEVSMYSNVIKAFRVGPDDDPLQLSHPFEGIAYCLFDTKADQLGGTGKKFNWNQLLLPLQHSFFLSGGIDENDASEIIALKKKSTQLFAIDINSKFELSPGNKNINKISSFVDDIKKLEHE